MQLQNTPIQYNMYSIPINRSSKQQSKDLLDDGIKKTENPCPLPLYNDFLHSASQLESINKLHMQHILYYSIFLQNVYKSMYIIRK